MAGIYKTLINLVGILASPEVINSWVVFFILYRYATQAFANAKFVYDLGQQDIYQQSPQNTI